MNWFKDFIPNWKAALAADKWILPKMVFLLTVGNFNPYLFSIILPILQKREGTMIPDPLLDMIDPSDVSRMIFMLLYTGLFVTILWLLAYPKELKVGMKLYVVISYMRMITVYMIPLEPPSGLIYLSDPILAASVYKGHIITKDLFFSGHTATIVSCFMMNHHPILKWLVGFFAVSISYLLLVQHIHYTVDIIGAWMFSFLIYKFLTAEEK